MRQYNKMKRCYNKRCLSSQPGNQCHSYYLYTYGECRGIGGRMMRRPIKKVGKTIRRKTARTTSRKPSRKARRK